MQCILHLIGSRTLVSRVSTTLALLCVSYPQLANWTAMVLTYFWSIAVERASSCIVVVLSAVYSETAVRAQPVRQLI